jgi:alpha-mannosidase
MQVQTLFGLPPQLNAIRESLPIYLQAYSKPAYKPDVALIYGSQVENTDLYPSTATFADDWNKVYAYPKLTYSTFPDFFHYLDKNYADGLPIVKADGGGYWEDGIGSDAYFEAEDRQNQNRALSAEILSTTDYSLDPNLNPPTGLFADIWRNIILFAEHTWLSYNSVSQPDHDESVKQLRVKDDRADRAALEIEDAVNRSLSQLANEIYVPANTLVVFNSLNWKRSLLVETDLFDNPTLVDLTTNQQVPLEILSSREHFLHVRFFAADIPAVGYKCFSIQYGKQAPPEALRAQDQTIENAYYRVTVDANSGALASIFDKQLGRELVDPNSPYKFGQYLYVTGGDGDTQMINPFPALPAGELTVHGSSDGKFLGVETMPWGKSIRTISKDANTPRIETEILLFNDQKKIEFRYRVQKDYTNNKEAVYFAFPVSATRPEFSYAMQQGWVDPAHGLMKGGSLEWFNVQQWMAVHDLQAAVGIVPLDASLASFGDINRGKWPGTFEPKTATIFSYAMNNYWHTNYRAGQGGDFTFRYTVTSAAQLDGGALSRLGLDEMRPPEVDYVVGQDKVGNPVRPLPAAGEGFVETSGANAALITWKKAENGDGTVMRLQELDGKPADVALHLTHGSIQSAKLCSGVETNIGDLPVQGGDIHVSLKPFEVVTVRVGIGK